MAWATLENGRLLRAAEEAGFDVLVTADKNIYYQQNNATRRIALVVLSDNYWPAVDASCSSIQSAVSNSTPGGYTEVQVGSVEHNES